MTTVDPMLRDMLDVLAGTGAHVGHRREQVGRCVYCSCGSRVQGQMSGKSGTVIGRRTGAMTTHDRHSLVAPTGIDVEDCHFRMLKPREHLRAQRFEDDYIVLGNQGEQTMQAGNAVSSNVAQWLGDAVRRALEAA